jgi:histidyl-tRNA synthetase
MSNIQNSFPSQPYKGTRDFYPEELQKRNYIFKKWREILTGLGFVEYETSLLENAEIYIAKSGEELGGSQLYNFKDKGDRFVALRPEQTPSLARIVANKFSELNFPLRWFSIPNCFRYERPQKGRLREHWQLNVDIIGHSGMEAELEIFNILGKIFLEFGANKSHFKIMFNHRQVLDKWLINQYLINFKEVIYKVLDNWFKLSLEENVKILDENKLDKNQIQQIVDLTAKQNQAWENYLELCHNQPEIDLLLKTLPIIRPDVEYELNPCIIRGIAYYTGVVLEAFDKNPDNSRALFGGGRYDNLMELFGKESPAIGFGFGDVTMHQFLTGHNLYPNFNQQKKVAIMPFNQDNLLEIFTKIIPKLEKENTIYEINYEYERSQNKRYKSLKKQGFDDVIKVGFI